MRYKGSSGCLFCFAKIKDTNTTMKTPLLLSTLTVLLSTSVMAQEQCPAQTALDAHYQTQRTLVATGETEQTEVELLRQEGLVMHRYPNGLGDIWHKVTPTQLRLDRFFDNDKRLIEYESADLSLVGKQKSWSSIYHMIEPSFLQQLTQTKTEGTGCDLIITYTGSVHGRDYTVKWNPNIELLVSLSMHSDTLQESWKMTSLQTEPQQIQAAFDQRFSYMNTDFADIGDNEADPFLVKMINLGYIEHAPEAVYDANGNNIAKPMGDHGHSHGTVDSHGHAH
jgi:hypothetical protein